MKISNYNEQKRGLKTTSIRVVYEWIYNFLGKIRSKLTGTDRLTKYMDENISKEIIKIEKLNNKYCECSKQKNPLKLIKARQDLCNELLKLVGKDGLIEKLYYNLKLMCVRGSESFKELQSLKSSPNFGEINKEIKAILDDTTFSDDDYKGFKECANNVLKLIIPYNSSSGERLERDLNKIKKEKAKTRKLTLILSKSVAKFDIKSAVLNYGEYVTKRVKEYKNDYIKIVGDCAKDGKYTKALNGMLDCWDKKYSYKKIKKSVINKKYCSKLLDDMGAIAKQYSIMNMNEPNVLFIQLLTRTEILLRAYIKNMDNNFQKENIQKEMDDVCGKIYEDENNGEKDKSKINEMLGEIEGLNRKFNLSTYKYQKYIDDFNKIKDLK